MSEEVNLSASVESVEVYPGAANDSSPSVSPISLPATLTLDGEIGKEDLPQIMEMLFRIAHRGVTRIVIDFDGVTHFDFRGVKPLVQRAELFRRAGGDIKLSGLSPYLHAIFRSAGGAGAFDLFAEKSQAVSAFMRPAPQGG